MFFVTAGSGGLDFPFSLVFFIEGQNGGGWGVAPLPMLVPPGRCQYILFPLT